MTEPVGRKLLTLDEAIKWGLIDQFVSEIHDIKQKKTLSLEEALNAG